MTAPTTDFALVNNTDSSNAFAYITGLDLNRNNEVVFIQADGKTVYRPRSPSSTQHPLEADVAIPLGAPGSTKRVTIPQLAGGRIWFVVGGRLTFLLNPGPAVVEPSAVNPTDPNHGLRWGFAEFTYNKVQLFVNISYVDFVSLPISLKLRNTAGREQVVQGIAAGGVVEVARRLEEQGRRDGAGWGRLVVRGSGGGVLRVLSPNSGRVTDTRLFAGYYDAYVDAVWKKYAAEDLVVNTQWEWRDLRGRVGADGLLRFGEHGAFGRPSAGDIFSCSTGPFGGYPPDKAALLGNVGARLAAALNRSTLLANPLQPDGERIDRYYKERVTNHYARVVHEVAADGRGYAFPYDDVVASGDDKPDQAGTVFDGAPELLTVTLGGLRASASDGDGGDEKAGAADHPKQDGKMNRKGPWNGLLGYFRSAGSCFGRS
ncbi:hypothetical protein DL764_005252 [Monosporascus ibericus]|uniref:GH64 domain-containing protein n=1 Tax=Monosporascus ibericus TaxID=155417 RepID=A0A4V1XAM4_9PEZI|nr:hypothetical protein DL764_005252 [Monosporascus ibericus]